MDWNTKSDKLATKSRHNHPTLSINQQQLWFPTIGIQLYLNIQPIQKWFNSCMHQASTTEKYINYLHTKLNWTSQDHNEVDWIQKAQIMKKSPSTLHPWIIKLNTNRLLFLGEKFMQFSTSMCPICHHTKETTDHFLTCKCYPILKQE